MTRGSEGDSKANGWKFSTLLYLLVWITPPFEAITYAISKFMRKSCSYHIFTIFYFIIHVPSRVALLGGGVVN